MKKFIALLLALITVFSLCACGKQEKKEPELSGGWSEEKTELSEADIAVFQKAVEGTEYAELTPSVLLGTQVVAGTNFKFLCTDASGAEKTVVVYRDLEGNCTVTSVE